MRSIVVVVMAVVTGCLPRPQPAQPVAPQPAPIAQPDPNVAVAPAPPPPVAQPLPPPPPPQPLPPVQQPQPQPYPPPYVQRPYVFSSPTVTMQPPAAQSQATVTAHSHDAEVITDFAIVGTLASIDIMSRQDITDGTTGSFVLLAGVAGGGALGWMLADRFPLDNGAAHTTTIGLAVGMANGALLIEPTKWEDADQVLGLLLLGSAVGAGGGFLYGQTANLTSGQSYFVANMTLLGSATAAFGAIIGSSDGQYGGRENGALAVGLDGGVAAGAIIAPSLDWSPRRAKIVLASTAIGAVAGGMLAGLTTSKKGGSTSDPNGDVVASCMAAGMWGGFGFGIVMTRDDAPDAVFAHPTTTATTASTSTTFAPWVGQDGHYGVMAGGTF